MSNKPSPRGVLEPVSTPIVVGWWRARPIHHTALSASAGACAFLHNSHLPPAWSGGRCHQGVGESDCL